MASINEILGKNIDSVKALKAEIKSLQDSLVGLDSESQEFKDTSLKLVAAQEELTKVTRAGKEENVAATDSIRGMEKEYKSLYDTYKMLSEEQRNSSFGKEMASQLETLSTKLNETKQGVGNFKDNIGRYASSVTEAFSNMGMSAGALQGPLKAATTGVKGFGTSLKALAANPVVLVITALVAILAKAAAAIKNNEELTNRLKEAMSVFRPVLDGISNAFDFLAGILVKTVEGLTKVAEKIMSVIPGMKQAIQSHKELAKATNDLTIATREANIENSKKEAEIERLREEASETENVVEKKKLLEEAKAMQAEIDQKNIELAQEELRILQEYGEKTANSAEENEKLAAAQQKVNQAVAQGERNMRQYNKQISQVEKSTKSAGSSTKNYREEAKKLYEETVEHDKTEIQRITEKYEREKKLLEKYGYDTKLLTKKYNEDRLEIVIKEVKKEKEVITTFINDQIDNINRSYSNAISMAGSQAEKLYIAGSNFSELKKLVETQKAKIEEIINSSVGDVKVMWNYVFNNADLRKLDDFDYMKEFLSVFTSEVEKEDIDKIINSFNNIASQVGEQGWIAFTSGITNSIKNLNNNGIDIKNLPDFGPRAKDLGTDAAEKFYEAFLKSIDEKKQETEVTIYEWFSEVYGVLGDFNTADNEILFEEYKLLEQQKTIYEAQLENFSGTTEQKLEILERYYSVVEELETRQAALSELNQQRTQEMVDNLADAMDGIGNSLGTVKSSYESLIDSELKAGKIDEKTANEKKKRLQTLEKIQTAFSIATIAADAASGLFTIWKGYATETGVINPQTAAAAGPGAAVALGALNAKSLVSAIAKSASLAATATAQIMAAKNGTIASANNFSAESSGGGSTGVVVTPAVIDSSPYSYTRSLQTEEDVDMLNERPVIVKVVDIEDALNARDVRVSESSF